MVLLGYEANKYIRGESATSGGCRTGLAGTANRGQRESEGAQETDSKNANIKTYRTGFYLSGDVDRLLLCEKGHFHTVSQAQPSLN